MFFRREDSLGEMRNGGNRMNLKPLLHMEMMFPLQRKSRASTDKPTGELVQSNISSFLCERHQKGNKTIKKINKRIEIFIKTELILCFW